MERMERFENLPHHDAVIGLSSEYRHLNAHVEDAVRALHARGGEAKEGYEVEKTERDLEILSLTNRAANGYMKQYGRKKIIEIQPNHIHVLREGGVEELLEGTVSGGAHSEVQQDILIDKNENDIQFALIAFHELMHLKTYSTLQVTKTDDPEDSSIEPYHSGFAIYSRDGKVSYFKDFDEGMTGFFTRKFFEEHIKHDALFREEWGAFRTRNQKPEITRSDELEKLETLAHDLWQNNGEEYPEFEQVFDLFIDAYVNGHLLRLVRLVEKTYGAGSFRALAEANRNELENNNR